MINLKETGRSGEFSGSGKLWNYRKIGVGIREGLEFKIMSDHGEDITKQILAKVAFQDITTVPSHHKNLNEPRFAIEDVIAAIMTEDALLDLILMGGAREYMLRKLSGR